MTARTWLCRAMSLTFMSLWMSIPRTIPERNAQGDGGVAVDERGVYLDMRPTCGISAQLFLSLQRLECHYPHRHYRAVVITPKGGFVQSSYGEKLERVWRREIAAALNHA